MPTVTRKDFAALCGDDILKINVWIKRKKISVLPDNKKLIDTENPLNGQFLAERRRANNVPNDAEYSIPEQKVSKIPGAATKKEPKNAKTVTKISKKVTESRAKSPEKPIIETKKPIKSQAKQPEPKEIRQKERVLSAREIENYNRDIQKLHQEERIRLQKIEIDEIRIQSEKIRLDKTAGNLLPIDLGMGVIERHANSILKTFEKGFERIAEIYATMAGFDPQARADFLKECREELADCVKRAGESAANEIEILVDNYAETLMIGQKKA